MRARTIIFLLVAGGFLRGAVVADPGDPPRVAIPHDVYERWFDSYKKTSGAPQDDADIQQCVLATYPTMKFKQRQKRLWAGWVTPDQVIVPTFTGGAGGGTKYLCVVNRQDGHWRFDQAYYQGNFD
jgi:hypothetical protein